MRDDTVSVEVPVMTDEERVLRRARDLISDPERWTQGCIAQSRDGLWTEPCDSNAYRWCVNGAIISAAHRLSCSDDVKRDAIYAINRACRLSGLSAASTLNDNGTHADVMALLDRAIASYR